MTGIALPADAPAAASRPVLAALVRRIEPIWRIRGRLPLPPGQSAGEALDRVTPLLREVNTTHQRSAEAIDYSKTDPAAQDRLAVFERGTIRVEPGPDGPMLAYDLVSRALLFCFLAPLLFLAMAQMAVLATALTPAPTAAEKKAAEEKEKKKDKEMAARRLHPIDQLLGAPAPETKKDKDKKKKEKDKDKDKDAPSPTPGYVFAGIFAALYAIGRWLEPWLVRRLFRRALAGGEPA